jgi:hypothetical protein
MNPIYVRSLFCALCVALALSFVGACDEVPEEEPNINRRTPDEDTNRDPTTDPDGGLVDDAGADPEPEPTDIEIAGTWVSNFGDEETIANDQWITPWSTQRVVEFNNDENAVILQNPADDAFNPNAYVKIVWTEIVDNAFYYCWVIYSAATLDEIYQSTATADASDPATRGCGESDFAWTALTSVN